LSAAGESATQPVAGRRVNWLSAVTVGFLALFLGLVLVLLVADLSYTRLSTVLGLFRSRPVLAAMRLTAISSTITLALVVLFSVPVGYALSRYRFPGHAIADTMVDLPIVLPPVVIGVSLLVLFATGPGKWLNGLIESAGLSLYSALGIVMCQFLVSASYGIRSAKAAFDSVDRRLEHLALTLGASHWQAFRRVTLPIARNGLIAGIVMAWARAVGVFGPLMVFVGAMRMKTEVMPTTIYLELTVGRVEVALAVAMVMLALATVALVIIHRLASGRRWWGA